MSTTLKEWLVKTIMELEEERDAVPGAVNEDAAMALAAMKIALASLEAEPVVFRSKLKPPSAIGSENWDYTDHRQPDAFELESCVIERLYTAPPAPVVPAEFHPDTQKLVTDFCTALAEKLYKAQLKYGYDADWKQDGWPTQCQAQFHQHIAKGDPRDVAAYCAFMWYHGWKTEPAPVSVPDEATPENIEILASTYAPSGITYQWDRDECNAAADSWNSCRAALHQEAEQTNYRAIVERIAEIIHGKVTDIDLLTVTVKSMKDKLQR